MLLLLCRMTVMQNRTCDWALVACDGTASVQVCGKEEGKGINSEGCRNSELV